MWITFVNYLLDRPINVEIYRRKTTQIIHIDLCIKLYTILINPVEKYRKRDN